VGEISVKRRIEKSGFRRQEAGNRNQVSGSREQERKNLARVQEHSGVRVRQNPYASFSTIQSSIP
jgi:hypothetical protein